MRPTRTALAATLLCATTLVSVFLLLAPASGQAFSLGSLFGSRVDKQLVAQVPRDKRGAIDKADFELVVAGEEVALAKLKEDLADKQKDLAALGTKLAKAQAEAAELILDSARIDAVDSANLGKKEDNVKLQAELRADRTKNEAERIQLKSKMDQTEVYVRDLKERVVDKEKTVAGLKARHNTYAGAVAAPAPAPALAPAPKIPEPLEIINKQPEPAAPAPAPLSTPEADLKN